MSILINPLFFLPIHKQNRLEYDNKRKKWIDETAKNWQQRDELYFGEKLNFDYENAMSRDVELYFPPWKFNEIVGFLDIGMDGNNCMTANVWLRRKIFPNESKKRGKHVTILQNQQYLLYSEVDKEKVDIKDNKTFLKALNEILKKARKIIKKRNKKLQLWYPDYKFECFNFVKAYQQCRNKNKILRATSPKTRVP